MKTKKEDWFNTVIYINNREQSKSINDALVKIGFYTARRSYLPSGYIRINGYGEVNKGSVRKDWRNFQADSREFEYEEAIAALSGQSESKSVRTNFDETKVRIPNKSTLKQVMDKLLSLGYREYAGNDPITWEEMESSDELYLYIWDDKDITSGGPDDKNYTLISVSDILETMQLINTNNTPLNTKTDGETIIRTKTTTIANGQRPTGSVIRGRTSRTQISCGHLNNETIRSES